VRRTAGEGVGFGLHGVGDLHVHVEEFPFVLLAGVHHALAFLLVELVAFGAAPSLVRRVSVWFAA